MAVMEKLNGYKKCIDGMPASLPPCQPASCTCRTHNTQSIVPSTHTLWPLTNFCLDCCCSWAADVALLHCCWCWCWSWSCTSRHRMHLIDTPTAAAAKSATAISSTAPTDTRILRILPDTLRYWDTLCIYVSVSLFFPTRHWLGFWPRLPACLPAREFSSRHFFWPTNYAEML